MKIANIFTLLAVTVSLFSADLYTPPLENKFSERAQKFIDSKSEATRGFVIYFTDKNIFDHDQFVLAKNSVVLDKKTIARRAKTFKRKNDLILFSDIPVHEGYIEELDLNRIRSRSKWFNFVSAEISAEKALDISDKEFVRKIDILPKKNRPPVIDQVKPSQIEKDDFYGYTLGQVKQINIPSAHALGYYGQGTRLLMIDTGFDQDHEAFDSLTVVDEWDFIFNDGETGNDESDFTDQEGHGTACWSIAAGYEPGTFVGPAFRADFLLAKTEDYLNESTLEEDYMVAALEWGEARGADVASISLGYSTFDDPADNYTYADMDGQTAICTLGAKRAAYLGMVVCNSMGNSGNSSWKYLTAPSDADSIVSVGAVDINGNIASFSSYGPSYDGRIKPEVVAMGVSDYCANSGTGNGYTSGSGTSFSTPLVAGAACVVLSANPGWTNMQVREALMMTADRASDPDSTRYGWGLIDVLAAINYTQVEIFSEDRTVQGFKLYQNYPNPFNPSTQISFELPVPGMVDLQIYDINGTKVETLIDSRKGAGIHTFTFDASKYSNGTFFYSLAVDGKTVAVKKMILIK